MIIQIPTEGFEDQLIHTYSDQNKRIMQVETGIIYDAADDVAPVRYTYIETDEDIQEEPDPEQTGLQFPEII